MGALWWFTEEDGNLCVGMGEEDTAPDTLAPFVISTGVRVRRPVTRRLTEAEAAQLAPVTRGDVAAVATRLARIVAREEGGA